MTSRFAGVADALTIARVPHPDIPFQLLKATWVAPMSRPPIRDGAVVHAGGTIIAVSTFDELQRAYPGAEITDVGDGVLLPGLVNAHVHLELSALTPGEPPGRFVDWIKRLVPRSPLPAEVVGEFARRGVAEGVRQCLLFGVTSVGDISRQCGVTRPLLKRGPLRVVSYGEVQAMANRRGLLEERVAAAVDAKDDSSRLRAGISPHAPYSVEMGGYRRCLEAARERGLPLATHLAETADETPFLARHEGPFRELWEYLGAWDDAVPAFAGGPIRFAHAAGMLDYPTLLAHVNYCDDKELALLAAGRASVAYCPRTHAYFGHPPHRWREMLRVGINVAVGTDSCASSPDLNLVDDLRLLRRLAPEVPPHALWELATVRPARAIGMETRVGTLEGGKAADFVLFAASGNDPLATVLESETLPKQVWIAGEPVPISCQMTEHDS
ncbi:MAG TPA: amidohydrolase family protein [Tepidisphaeraceae bacterium]|nr:amidohydrolase family protein [Tepidisphaeraceae bacterium]